MDELYARMFVCRLVGENKDKCVMDEELCVGNNMGTQCHNKLREDVCY